MNVLMVSAKVKDECVDDVIAAATKMFAAIEEAQPEGIRYSSCLKSDGVTAVALLEIEDGVENPLPALPAFQEFQANLPNWVAEPPALDQLTVVGSYRMFG